MIKIPKVMGGSEFTSSEVKVRNLFKIKIINKKPNNITNKIIEDLKNHLENNYEFSICSDDDCQYSIILIDETCFEGDKYFNKFYDYETLQGRIDTKFYYHLLDLAENYVESYFS
jgi:hypothetical protein